MAEYQHPRPQLERPYWRDLGGFWRFAFDDAARLTREQVCFDRQILVPYAPESARSGIGRLGYHRAVWYSTLVRLSPQELSAGRLLLHFGAVDYHATVWVNGSQVVQHTGGHTPFFADVTEVLLGDELEIVVRAEDDPHDLAKPRGKQDWLLKPHSIWYPRTTGIWQPVWLEAVPPTRIVRLRWTPDVPGWQLGFEAHLAGPLPAGLSLRVRLNAEGQTLVEDRYALNGPAVARSLKLPDPGIDDLREQLLWSPEHPQLIEAELELIHGNTVLDSVKSYTAMRSVRLEDRRFLLNERPYYLRMVLDQGYWPEGLMTASDAELRRDVELTRQLGFNGSRKHQKLENPRWLYWCDRIGLLVWNEMPSAYAFSPSATARLTHEWLEVLERDYSHPCVVGWVPFNESWGVPDLPTQAAQRDLVRSLYHLTKAQDSTRLVSANDGWEQPISDIVAIHDYTPDPQVIRQRYHDTEALHSTLQTFRPGGRKLVLEGFDAQDCPAMLTEFGGIALSQGDGWGYSRAQSSEAFLEHYTALLEAVHLSESLAGFCYTQLTDTFQEKNGLLYANRSPKADLSRLSRATRGLVQQPDETNPLGYSLRWLEKQAKSVVPQQGGIHEEV
jgi:hypothetical protein